MKFIDTNIAKRALGYLESEQNENGSWNEQQGEKSGIPEWRQANNHKAILYQTSNAVFWLSKYSSNRKCIENGINYLRENYQDQNEYLHTKWLYASILSREYSWDNNVVCEIVDGILNQIDRNVPASMITWMLYCFSVYGINGKNKRLLNIIDMIKQAGNGSIKSEDDDSYKVNATLELVKIHKYYVANGSAS